MQIAEKECIGAFLADRDKVGTLTATFSSTTLGYANFTDAVWQYTHEHEQGHVHSAALQSVLLRWTPPPRPFL